MKTLLLVSSFITALIAAAGAGAESDDRGWQLKKLFSPTSRDLAREAAGHVFIFDGLRDTDVRQAMQSESERIGSMCSCGLASPTARVPCCRTRPVVMSPKMTTATEAGLRRESPHPVPAVFAT